MLETLVLVISFISIGYLTKRMAVFPKNSADVLNSFVLNISLPAIIVLSISKLSFSNEMFIPIGMHWFIFLLHFCLILLLNKIFSFSRSVFACLLIVTTLGNTAFLGIPMLQGFFGEKAIPYAILYDQLGSGIGYILIGSFVLPYFDGSEKRSFKQIFKRLMVFPPFVALVLGFLFNWLTLPALADYVLTSLSKTLIPCAMIAVGMSIKIRMDIGKVKPLALGLGLKLILMPAIALVVAKLFLANDLSTNVSVLQAGMPPMVTAGAMAMSADIEKELAAAFVGMGLLFSFISLSIFESIL